MNRDGTTDVTRTVHFGEPAQDEKVAFTAILKGHISLSTAKFPKGLINTGDNKATLFVFVLNLLIKAGECFVGTTGRTLDSICRSVLW